MSRLFVERAVVFAEYEKWISRIPEEVSKSRAIEADDGRILAVEVKKLKTKIGLDEVDNFISKIKILKAVWPGRRILPAYLALGGFTEKAQARCGENGVGFASRMTYVQREWGF